MARPDLVVPQMTLAYVPVLHRGYRTFYTKHQTASWFGVLGSELIAQFAYLRKEIRQLDPPDVVMALRIWYPVKDIQLVTPQVLESLAVRRVQFVLPDEDICHELARIYLEGCEVQYDQTFLRWDRKNSLQEHLPIPHRSIPVTRMDYELMGHVFSVAQKSSDWWRRVGGMLVRGQQVLFTAHNRHLPTDYTPYIDGDPRNAFFQGVNIELGTALHAEKLIICEAARKGVRTEGAHLYVSTFPCPPCAKAIVAAGITRCYYSEGYAVLDGERVLRDHGVEIIHVGMPQ